MAKEEKTFREKLPILLLALMIGAAATHTFLSIRNLPNDPENPQALVGLAPGRLDWVSDQYNSMSQRTKVILATEWMLVILIALVSLIRGRMKLNKELKHVDVTSRKALHKKKPETDIDLLYNMLQRDKTLRLNAIGKVFGVDNKVALEWCRILESCNLAEIRYPTVGDPKITLNEHPTTESNE